MPRRGVFSSSSSSVSSASPPRLTSLRHREVASLHAVESRFCGRWKKLADDDEERRWSSPPPPLSSPPPPPLPLCGTGGRKGVRELRRLLWDAVEVVGVGTTVLPNDGDGRTRLPSEEKGREDGVEDRGVPPPPPPPPPHFPRGDRHGARWGGMTDGRSTDAAAVSLQSDGGGRRSEMGSTTIIPCSGCGSATSSSSCGGGGGERQASGRSPPPPLSSPWLVFSPMGIQDEENGSDAREEGNKKGG